MTQFHRVGLVTIDDAATFARFLTEAGPVIRRYGGELERAVVPDRVVGAVDRPTVVNVVHYDSQAAFEALLVDPEFVAVVTLRDRSARLISIEGDSDESDFDGRGHDDRLYLVEIAAFGAGGRAGYQAYDARAREVMGPYGYHVELMMSASSHSAALPFRPDVVKVAYFDSPDCMQRFEADPRHAELEGDAYAAAVSDSIWLVGRCTG